MPLAYHADADIHRLTLFVGVPLTVLVVVACLLVALRLPAGEGLNRLALVALAVALFLVPLGAIFVLPLLVVPLAGLVVSAVAVRRVPEQGGKWIAIGAIALNGLAAAWVAATTVACVVTDACFH